MSKQQSEVLCTSQVLLFNTIPLFVGALFSNVGSLLDHQWSVRGEVQVKVYVWKTLGTPHQKKYFDLKDRSSNPDTFFAIQQFHPENDLIIAQVSSSLLFCGNKPIVRCISAIWC